MKFLVLWLLGALFIFGVAVPWVLNSEFFPGLFNYMVVVSIFSTYIWLGLRLLRLHFKV